MMKKKLTYREVSGILGDYRIVNPLKPRRNELLKEIQKISKKCSTKRAINIVVDKIKEIRKVVGRPISEGGYVRSGLVSRCNSDIKWVRSKAEKELKKIKVEKKRSGNKKR